MYMFDRIDVSKLIKKGHVFSNFIMNVFCCRTLFLMTGLLILHQVVGLNSVLFWPFPICSIFNFRFQYYFKALITVNCWCAATEWTVILENLNFLEQEGKSLLLFWTNVVIVSQKVWFLWRKDPVQDKILQMLLWRVRRVCVHLLDGNSLVHQSYTPHISHSHFSSVIWWQGKPSVFGMTGLNKNLKL